MHPLGRTHQHAADLGKLASDKIFGNANPTRRQAPALQKKGDSTPRGFEPLRTKSTHLAGERLNHSAKASRGVGPPALSLR